jgi:hypothetical protein
MALTTSRCLLIIATLIGGMLAGGDIDRSLVAMPAWQRVGATSWAAFSRHADLANGLVLYPVEAVGGAAMLALAAVALHFGRFRSRAVLIPLYGALAFAITGLLLTLKAAPLMLSIDNVDDPQVLQQTFEGFRFWGDIRGACQILAFVLEVFALVALVRCSAQREQ